MIAAVCAWRRPRLRVGALAMCTAALGALRAGQAFAEDRARLAPRAIGQSDPYAGGDPPRAACPDGERQWDRLDIEAQPVGVKPCHRVRVLGDPDLLGLEPVSAPTLEGRLVPADGRAPPVLLYARLVALPSAAAVAADGGGGGARRGCTGHRAGPA